VRDYPLSGRIANATGKEVIVRTHLVVLPCLLVLFGTLACGGDEYGPGPEGGGGQQAFTGILVDAQRPPDKLPMKKTLDKWQVTDMAGNVIFSNADIPKSSKAPSWEWRRAKTQELTARFWLGTNPYVVKVIEDDYPMDENNKILSATWKVGDATAAELREMPNLKDLLKRQMLMFLIGKQGQ
jgi:hypothetical protein